MKKILIMLSAITLFGTTAATLVSCGGAKDGKTIVVGYVDNGKDKSEKAMMEKTKAKFDEIYGDLGFKIQLNAYQDENQIPEIIEKVGNNKDIPDVYAAYSSKTTALANQGYILPLEGINSPWGKDGGASILKNMNYNEAGSENSQKLLDDILNGKKVSTEDQWNHFMPYAIEMSKTQSRNTSTPDEKAVQYGITKHLGVGGGSAIINKATDKDGNSEHIKMLQDLKLIEDNTSEGIKWITGAKTSISDIVAYMQNTENANQLFTLFDRGMWWMYPVYANAMVKEGKGKGLKAADIGINWKNLNSGELQDLYVDNAKLKYSSIFGNERFKESTKEILVKWFELFAQQTISAKKILDAIPGNDVSTNYENLFHPTENSQVQARLISENKALGVNYEPGSYIDMLPGFKLFNNMDYMPLNKVEIFDSESEDEKETAKVYSDEGLNTWLTPVGSGTIVFNKNLVASGSLEKAEAAQRFVELEFGFLPDQAGKIIGDGTGGIRNLDEQFASTSDSPMQLAIADETNLQSESFKKAMDVKVTTKYNRAMDEFPTWDTAVDAEAKLRDKTKAEIQAQERKAILSLETKAVTLAADLYSQGGKALSLAPNNSAFDEADNDDYHGKTAMQPTLTEFLGKSKNIGDWDAAEIRKQALLFADKLMGLLAKHDEMQSEAE